MPDYYSILSRAVAGLTPNTPEARTALFHRAMYILREDIRINSSRWNAATAQAEQEKLEAAIDRIESESSAGIRRESRRRQDAHARSAIPPTSTVQELTRRYRPSWRMMAAGAAMLAVFLGGYAYFVVQRSSANLDAGTRKSVPDTQRGKRDTQLAGSDEIEPGIDGGSSGADLPYFFRRQVVYYRSVHSAGMIVVDRSQRYLYLLEPQVRAVRYGIGIGGECSLSGGLHRISRVAEWPEWRPSPDLLKRRAYPKTVAGGPGNPLGARAIYFENDELGIHGTNAPKSIGQATTLGCFRMVNDDITDLAKRIAPGAGVVVMN